MKVCVKCGYRDNPLWRSSRFDLNAEYMRWEDAETAEELSPVVEALRHAANFAGFQLGPYIYYRRGTGGLWLYRVLPEDFKVPRERKRHGGLNAK